ncbi:hypothetical protein P4O66_009004 [Electrophorus voltai]|uniref:Tensin-3-like n=1 Tax=Electrophorus voltai TaxID=2609070 RepID=A0AAD8ZA63_9TELE|nr:hypothetical protein P4O66_009004 [Electrophorus voltai]
MAAEPEFDLSYITERIIAVSFHSTCPEQTYLRNLQNITQMLQSKHADNYLVLDVGWPELRAPSLHLLCSLCKSMENWLDTCSEHVLLLHCRGNKDRIGVVISSYIQLPSVSTSEEQALDRYTMKRFYSDKMASLMTPSQKRQAFSSEHTCIRTFQQRVQTLYKGIPRDAASVHNRSTVSVGKTHKVYFALEPPQLLKGDVMIVCYYKNAAEGSREPVFRLQFHTGTLHGHPSLFYKKDLDHANKDPRFPENGMVEVVFSETMTNIPVFPKGGTGWKNNSAVVIDYDTLDPLVYWDSYENLTTGDQPSAVSVSSDSDLSSNLQWTRGLDASHSLKELPHTQRPVAGHNMEDEQPPLGLVRAESLVAGDGDTRCSEATFHFNGKTASPERETDILDDEDGHVPRDTAAPGPGSKETDQEVLALSSLACKESCPCSVIQAERVGERESAVFGRGNHGMNSTRFLMHSSVVSGIQTDMWVRQQQLVSANSHRCTPSDGLDQRVEAELESGRSNSTLPASCSPDAKLEAEKDDEFASLALDIDQSIEQLNQLILDLDPEFEPVPTRARNHMTRSASLHTNGIGHSAGQAKFMHSGWRQRQISDVTNQSALRRPAADLLQPLPKCTVCTAPKCGSLYRSDSIDYGEFASETVRPLCVDLQPPPTPTFPVSPPTPYDSRGYVDSMTHAPVSSDGDLFHSEVTPSPASCQTSFGSMRSVHTPSPLPASDGTTAAHRWLESGSNAPLSHYTPQPSPLLSLSAPNAHSSPRGLPRGLSSSVGVGSLERSLLEAMEGLESLGLDGTQPPLLPQKRRELDGEEHFPNSPLRVSGAGRNSGSPRGSTPSPDQPLSNKPDNAKFVQDTSKFWYKPDISREQAIAVLKDKEPGSFIVRDSHSFRGAYGLAMKVATPPPSIIQQSKKGDLTSELVRHFLIECTQKGVRLKGCPNEPYFETAFSRSLTALVCQHSITSLALPCRLNIPSRDPLEELNESQGQTSTNSAAELLKQGAACNVWFLGSVELESLTGVQAVQKATTVLLGQDPPVTSTIVHFKVSAQGITLTDNQRKLFFRRHYAVNTVIFCALDPQARKWTRDGCLAAKIFGFVARKSGSGTENMCHLFAEHDPEQPASAIVNFVSKVMIGSQKAK